MNKNNKKAFTLAEVLITLTVLGVVAAMTVPTIVSNHKMKQFRVGVVKAQSAINNAVNKFYVENGVPVECGYWEKNPYGGGAKCVDRNELGNCARYEMPDGSPLPSDYNGYFSDCSKFWNYLKKGGFNTSKVCDSNGYANGCQPEYNGYDTLYKGSHSDASDYDINAATSGCSGFRKASIQAKATIVTADGMIWFPYSTGNLAIIAVDVNGEKGPNKWGHDVHTFQAKRQLFTANPIYYPQLACITVEAGGVTTKTLVYNTKKY